ncbi:MAG TPA: hypothetical protein VMF69_20880 [Gemmataceae bacterium]|nr:hypothetical protein [Gemmataceae bacterium]
MSGQMLGWWKRVRDGTLTKVRFAGRLHAQRDFRVRFRAVLERGSACGCAKMAATCRELLHGEVSMFFSPSSMVSSRPTTRPSVP